MSSSHRLRVACVLDHNVIGQVLESRPLSGAARYDLSVVLALRAVCREVELISAGAATTNGVSRCVEALRRLRPHVVFNLAYSASPQEASFAGVLDMLALPYTGSSPGGIALANDKVRSRLILRAAGIRVPRFIELSSNVSVAEFLRGPVIVKPTCLAASVGIYSDSLLISPTAKRIHQLAARIARRFGVSALCEEFIIGREFRVGLVEGSARNIQIAGISEWVFGVAASGWGFKTESIRNNRRIRQSQRVTRSAASPTGALRRRLHGTARASMALLDVRGYATVDCRVDERGEVTVLEVNANPGLWAGGSVWTRPSFNTNISRILIAALHRADG
jgi:D-alanine-D-alanine ligase